MKRKSETATEGSPAPAGFLSADIEALIADRVAEETAKQLADQKAKAAAEQKAMLTGGIFYLHDSDAEPKVDRSVSSAGNSNPAFDAELAKYLAAADGDVDAAVLRIFEDSADAPGRTPKQPIRRLMDEWRTDPKARELWGFGSAEGGIIKNKLVQLQRRQAAAQEVR